MRRNYIFIAIIILMLVELVLWIEKPYHEVDNKPPSIHLSEFKKQYIIGEDPNWLLNIKAIDEVDGDLTTQIEVDISNVNMDLAGFYDIVYSVTDSSRNKETKVVTIEVIDDYFTYELLPFVNYSEEFPNDYEEDVPVYYFLESDLPYIDLSEYLLLVGDTLNEIIEYDQDDSKFQINASYQDDEININESMMFDFENNKVELSNKIFMSYMQKEPVTNYGEGLELVDYQKIGNFNPVIIDLNDYNINIFEYEGKLLVPLHLTNFLLSGSYYVYYNESKLVGYDMFVLSDQDKFYELINIGSDRDYHLKTQNDTRNFLALVFDHFYGLKDEHGYENAYEIIDPYLESDQRSMSDFYTSLGDFGLSLNDMHTLLILTGYKHADAYGNALDYEYFINYYQSRDNVQCPITEDEIVSYEYLDDDHYVRYIEIYGFSQFTKELIEAEMKTIEELNRDRNVQIEDVVIDVRCNGGGVLAGVLHVLKFMTNENIELLLDVDGVKFKEVYDFDKDYYQDYNYYVVSSNVSFSAANLFLTYVKDNDLAVIVGEKSYGGACSINIINTPDGSLFSMSSLNKFINKNYESVEKGVEPDINIDFNNSLNGEYIRKKVLEELH